MTHCGSMRDQNNPGRRGEIIDNIDRNADWSEVNGRISLPWIYELFSGFTKGESDNENRAFIFIGFNIHDTAMLAHNFLC